MPLKRLHLGGDLQEQVAYGQSPVPLAVWADHFDDYFRQEWACHWHDEFEFGVVLQGAVEYTLYGGQGQGYTRRLSCGDGVYLAPGQLHGAKALEPGTVVAGLLLPMAFFDMRPFGNIRQDGVQPAAGAASLFLRGADPGDRPLLSSIAELCAIPEQEPGYGLHCIEMVCRIWRLLSSRAPQGMGAGQDPPGQRRQQRLKEMVSFIHAHFGGRISVDDIARAAAVSRTECFRCFQSALQKTPVEYLTEYRLSMAAMLLANTSRAVSEIAYACGFCSPSYFGKLFKGQIGLSPKGYREQAARHAPAGQAKQNANHTG